MIKSEVLIAGALSAMNGLLADPEDRENELGWIDETGIRWPALRGGLVVRRETCPEAVARIAVDHAQALVAELVKRGELK